MVQAWVVCVMCGVCARLPAVMTAAYIESERIASQLQEEWLAYSKVFGTIPLLETI